MGGDAAGTQWGMGCGLWVVGPCQDTGAPDNWTSPTGDGLLVPPGGQVGGPVALYPLPGGWRHTPSLLRGGRGGQPFPRSPFSVLSNSSGGWVGGGAGGGGWQSIDPCNTYLCRWVLHLRLRKD